MSNQNQMTLLDPKLFRSSVIESFKKLNPKNQWQNPVMFVVYLGSILTSILGILVIYNPKDLASEGSVSFIFSIAAWLWFTVLFANFAESLAEGRSKAQAASLRGLKKSTMAKRCQAGVPNH
jgi:K+-transporting ATPase ATPase B chain